MGRVGSRQAGLADRAEVQPPCSYQPFPGLYQQHPELGIQLPAGDKGLELDSPFPVEQECLVVEGHRRAMARLRGRRIRPADTPGQDRRRSPVKAAVLDQELQRRAAAYRQGLGR